MLKVDSAKTSSGRPFGLWSATFLVVANMIGAGVFTTSGFSLADLGDRQSVMLAWCIGSVIAICGAVSYGQLAQRMTESGGEYLFLSRMVHPSVGFIAGWVSLLAGFTGAIALAATAFEVYGIPASVRPDWFRPGMAGVTVIALFGLLHSIVLKVGLVSQNLVVVLKLVLLVAFIAVAFSGYPSGWRGLQLKTEHAPLAIDGLASTLVWISLSFSGFNAAVYVTGEVDNPHRNVPRALVLGTFIVSILYLVLNYIFLYAAAPDEVTAVPDVAVAASKALGGERLAVLIRVIVGVGLLSSVSSMVVAGPRVYAKMAEDGVLPNLLRFSAGRPTDSTAPATPVAAIWLQVVLASMVACSASLKSQLDYLGFTLSVSAAITVACVFWTAREEQTRFQRFVFSSIALVYVMATIGLAILSAVQRPQQLFGFAATVMSGLILFFAIKTFAAPRSD